MKGSEVIELIQKIGVEKEVYIPCDDGDSQFYITHSIKVTMLCIDVKEKEVIVIDYE